MFFYSEFINIFIAFIIIFLVTFVIFLLADRFGRIVHPDDDKLSSYECGFDTYDDARNVFDIQFYLIAILFLVFDLEALYLFSWSISLSILDLDSFFGMLDFILELLIGYIYVWLVGAFNWK